MDLKDSAGAAAGESDARLRARHPMGVLDGIPVALKDNFDLIGTPTTASSHARSGRNARPADTDSNVAARLAANGAIIVGKTRLHEFAYGGICPGVRNPWDRTRVTGGSSGGSAATVSVGGALLAAGTDTIGSIRVPAALCGVTGFKPTFGRVGRSGVVPLSWSLDTVGWITNDVRDSAAAFPAFAGTDVQDPYCIDHTYDSSVFEDLSNGVGLDNGMLGIRVGVLPDDSLRPISPDVIHSLRASYNVMSRAGARIATIAPLPLSTMLSVAFTIIMCEAAEYHRDAMATTASLYTPDVRSRIYAGSLISAADYIHAVRARRMIVERFLSVFEDVDVIVMPTTPIPATKVGEKTVTWDNGECEGVDASYTRFMAPANLSGAPALSVPCGSSSDGLPLGLQIIAKPMRDDLVLRVGAAYQLRTDFVKHPIVSTSASA